jgi:GAF domain-containing protein
LAKPGLTSTLQEVLRSLAREPPIEETLNLIVRRVSELGAFAFCGIVLPEPGTDAGKLVASYGFPTTYVDRVNRSWASRVTEFPSPTMRALETKQMVVVTDVLSDDSYSGLSPLAIEYGYRSMICLPLVVEDDVIGVLNVYSHEARTPTASDLEMLQSLSDEAAVALRCAALISDKRSTISQLTYAGVGGSNPPPDCRLGCNLRNHLHVSRASIRGF